MHLKVSKTDLDYSKLNSLVSRLEEKDINNLKINRSKFTSKYYDEEYFVLYCTCIKSLLSFNPEIEYRKDLKLIRMGKWM